MTFETIKYQTDLNINEVINRLHKETGPVDFRPFGKKSKKLFEGKVLERSFEISRNTSERNSFRPIVVGELFEENGITVIICRFQLFPAVKYFLIAFVSFIFLFLFIALLNFIFNESSILSIIFPMFMLIFCVLLALTGYNMEAPIIKNELVKFLELKSEIDSNDKEEGKNYH